MHVHVGESQTNQSRKFVFKITPTQLKEHLQIFSVFDPEREKWMPSSLLRNAFRRSNIVVNDAEITRIISGLPNPHYITLPEYLRK